LGILSKSKGFNTHFFKCQVFVDEYEEITAWVGLQKDRIMIVEQNTGRIMRNIFYNKIFEWGKSNSELCLKVDRLGDFHIDSPQIEVIISIFENYLQYNYELIHS
jgi:hypothetical protein